MTRHLFRGMVIVLVLAVVSVPVEGTVIDQKQATLSDTAFHQWLEEYQPEGADTRARRYRLLTGSDRVSADSKLTYYREWTALRERVVRPNQQILLALRVNRSQQARDWLDQWLGEKTHGYRAYEKMVDNLVDAGKLEWAAHVIETARDRRRNANRFFRRMAAIQQTLGHPEQALDQYLKAYKRFRRSGYIRSRIRTILLNNDVDEALFRDVKRHTNSGTSRQYMLKLVEDYLLEQGRIDGLSTWFERLYSNREKGIARANTVVERLVDQSRYDRAVDLSDWLLNQRSNNEFLVRHGLILTRLNQPDSAVRSMNKLDTRTLTDTLTRRRDRVMTEVHLRSGRLDEARALLDRLGRDEGTHRLWIEWFTVNRRYEPLLGYLDSESLDRPARRFITQFKLGTVNDTLLNNLVNNHYRDSNTSLALALAGMSSPDASRKFLRWLDQFPFDSSIGTGPPQSFHEQSDRLPHVLLDRWFRRFRSGAFNAERLASLGRSLGYPPLKLAAAKAYRESDRPGSAITLLEEILIEHPETMLRTEVERLLEQLS